MEASPGDSGGHEVWLVTGAGRGMGADIARAALGAGHAVVATGRDPDAVADELGASDDLLATRLVMISSGAGLIGFAFSSVYAAAKAGLEGWTTALADEVAPFGISTTIVNPGFFRTELISERSMTFAPASVADYDDRRDVQRQWWQDQAGRQPGDPARLADALVTLAHEDLPPRRFLAGADALELAERKADELRAQADAYRQMSAHMAHEDEDPAAPARTPTR